MSNQLHFARLIFLGSTSLFAAGTALAQPAEAPPTASQTLPPAPDPDAAAVEPASTEASSDEIVVTARKRNEALIDVPITITAVGANELQRRGINSIDAVARVVPSLITGEGGGTAQGGIISIRGIAGADNNPLNDQAVSFNIDGVAIGRASVRRLSDTDIQQIEVLKGPQALFYGKNSPGGIISIRTADPTPDFGARISQGYEFRAREWRTEGYVSVPLTESLGFRLAGIYSDMKGWAKNIAAGLDRDDFSLTPGEGIFPWDHSRAPNRTDWAVRGTLKYDDGGRFDARAKFSYAKLNGAATTHNTQYVACPLGIPQNSPSLASGLPIDECKANDKVSSGNFSPAIHAYDPALPSDGESFMRQWQMLGSLEMNYDVTDELTLTSVTGYYKLELRNLGNFTQNYYESNVPNFYGPNLPQLVLLRQLLGSLNFLDLREFSQELRLASNFEGPFNFMVGGLYGDTYGLNGSRTFRYSVAPIWVNNYRYIQDGMSWSVFGQARFDITEQLELSGGMRYSKEKKELTSLESSLLTPAGALVPGNATTRVEAPNPTLDRKVSFTDVSPEVTISYKPTRNMNIYGSYKEGFLSGGYASLVPGALLFYGPAQPTYDQQVTKGFEVGVKAVLFDDTLRLNLAGYTYKTTGLQVGVTIMGVQPVLQNAGSVRTKGIDFDFNWRAPVEGLTITGAVNYNKGYYLDYQTSCYRGQPSTTCFVQTNRLTGATALLQDLSGQSLVRAPRWTGNLGFNYEAPITSGLKLGLSGNVSHSDKYFSDTTNTPGGLMKSYQLVDATMRVMTEDERWELALIGRNLTNTHYFVRSSDTPFTGSSPGCAPATAVPAPGCTAPHIVNPILGDTAASVSRGREVMLRVAFKY